MFALKSTQSALAASGESGVCRWAADKHLPFKTSGESPVPRSPPMPPIDTLVHLLCALQNEASHSGRVNYAAEPWQSVTSLPASSLICIVIILLISISNYI